MAGITFGGLASGLDTQALVKAIIDAERVPLQRLQERQQLFSQRKAAYNELDSKLSTLETALRDLSSPLNFRSRNISVSEEGFIRASAGPGAELGIFELNVIELAAASKVKSDGFAAADQSLVNDGTITLQAGSNEEISIDVSAAAGNNTLNQVRDAINNADAGVQAAILFDGSAYRLTVRSKETGLENALSITDGTNLGLTAATNKVSDAADALIEVDGIDVTSATNKVSGVIPGVTLDLISETGGAPVSVEVAQDNDKVIENVQGLIDAYNETIGFFNTQFSRDKPGALAGDSTARSIQRQLQSQFTGGVDGIEFGGIRSLSSIGVSFDGRTGEASLDASILRERLDDDFEAVGNLFLESGKASDTRIRFVGSTAATVPGSYDVEITQAAELASLIGSAPIRNQGINQDETLTITLNGQTVAVDLLSGDGIDEIVEKLNDAFVDAELGVSASDDGGALRLSSRGYGSTQDLTVESSRNDNGNGRRTGFDDTPANDVGQDVAGKIGGFDALGAGQVLTGAEDGDYSGLQIQVTATQATIDSLSGDFGSISFSRGLIPTALSQVDRYTRLGDGPIDVAKDGIDRRIKEYDDSIFNLEERLSLRERRLILTFAKAEQAIQSLNAQQNNFNSVA